MRKNTISLFLFILIAFSLSAEEREIKVYVLPVTGEGRSGDSNFFYQQLTYEVIFQRYSIVRASRGSDYILRGVIAPEPAADSRNFIFYLEMIESASDKVIAQQNITYTAIDSNALPLISTMVHNMLSTIPLVRGPDDWRYNYLYVGASAFWLPRLYFGESGNQSINWMNIGLGFSAEFHFLDFLAAGTGFQFSQDWVILSSTDESTVEFRDLIIDIPVMLKFAFRPGDIILAPYTGISLNFSVMQITQPSVLSWIIGLQFGFKAGPGALTIDPRVSIDLFPSSLKPSPKETFLYNRYTIQVGIGYQFAFIPRRGSRDY